MSVPQTDWEQGLGFSTRAGEAAFLQQVATETGLRLSVAGHSVLDHTIWRAELGSPTGTPIVFTAAQHGTEPGSREAALMWFRDLAYSTDSSVATFLSQFRLVLVTTMNPDGIEEPRVRSNGAGVNINRDWFTLTQPETRAGRKVITEVRPAIVVDLHEWSSASGTFTFGWGAPVPSVYPAVPAIDAMTQSLFAAGLDAVEDAGYETREYPVIGADLSQGTLRTATIPAHAVG
ncbi:MAG TPA: M14 family zinc carboxypeptidase, partial [Beutenbergiaceae bacterium]|nr:M14 family zinc carboxypeptidase [Beutenbergiaceae bacterium]